MSLELFLLTVFLWFFASFHASFWWPVRFLFLQFLSSTYRVLLLFPHRSRLLFLLSISSCSSLSPVIHFFFSLLSSCARYTLFAFALSLLLFVLIFSLWLPFFCFFKCFWALPFIRTTTVFLVWTVYYYICSPFVHCCCSCCCSYPFYSCSAAYCCCCCYAGAIAAAAAVAVAVAADAVSFCCKLH